MIAQGTGTAHDATIVVENTIPALEEALATARRRKVAEYPKRLLASAEATVDKLRAHLAAAEAELARLRAEQEG
jgi:hypothetical protein